MCGEPPGPAAAPAPTPARGSRLFRGPSRASLRRKRARPSPPTAAPEGPSARAPETVPAPAAPTPGLRGRRARGEPRGPSARLSLVPWLRYRFQSDRISSGGRPAASWAMERPGQRLSNDVTSGAPRSCRAALPATAPWWTSIAGTPDPCPPRAPQGLGGGTRGRSSPPAVSLHLQLCRPLGEESCPRSESPGAVPRTHAQEKSTHVYHTGARLHRRMGTRRDRSWVLYSIFFLKQTMNSCSMDKTEGFGLR